MSGLKTDVEAQRTGAIRRTNNRDRWPGCTLALLLVHTLLISSCLALLFTGYRFGGSEDENAANERPQQPSILLCLTNKAGGVNADKAKPSRGLLKFSPKEAQKIELQNDSVVTVSCGGPYILYPYLPTTAAKDIEEETFNITVVSRDSDTVLASVPFNTRDKATWQSKILALDRTDKISFFVNCSSKCPNVEDLHLRLQFMLTAPTCTA